MTLVVASDPNLGDALALEPVLSELARQRPDMRILMRNEAVAAIFPKSLRDRMDWEFDSGTYDIIRIGMWAAVTRFKRVAHPTQLLYMLAGLQPPKDVPRPKIVYNKDDAPAYDYVIAPFTADYKERGWSYANFCEVMERLAQEGATFALIGAAHNFKDLDADPEATYSVTRYAGKSLGFIASLIKNARKAVITLDSGPAHIAHAVNSPRHVLMMSSVNERVWAWPGAHLLYAPPHSWSVTQVVNAVLNAAEKG